MEQDAVRAGNISTYGRMRARCPVSALGRALGGMRVVHYGLRDCLAEKSALRVCTLPDDMVLPLVSEISIVRPTHADGVKD